MSRVERKIFTKESGSGLTGVSFKDFKRHILKKTLNGQLKEQDLLQISDDINLNIVHISMPTTNAYKMYKNTRQFRNGEYDSEYLLVMGFLKCQHESNQQAEDDLWSIINPSALETVPKERFEHILDIIMYYSIEIPSTLINFEQENEAQKFYNDTLIQKGKDYISQIKQDLPDQVSFEEFKKLLPGQNWYSSYKIRTFLCPEQAQEQHHPPSTINKNQQ